MAGDELSYSEYLRCKNACVKVTINRYSRLYSATLKEMYGAILKQLERREPTNTTLTVISMTALLVFVVNVEGYHCFLTGTHRPLKVALILHNFIFPILKQIYPLLPQFTQQDFELETIDHGSGFLIADNFVITNWHVIEEAMREETLVIRILNETIGELPCVVVHCDPSNDLALLYCHGLDLKRHGICPFALSEDALWPSLSAFSFGYPLTHTEESALFVKGYVSGLKNRYGKNRENFWVLSGHLNNGNSGSPVLRRIGDDIKVVGVVSQKHKKEILTLEELNVLEEERSTLQANSASDSRDQFWKSVSLKMYDALDETHCQFGYGNVVPGHVVVKFLSDPSVTSIVDCFKEMALCIETQGGVQHLSIHPLQQIGFMMEKPGHSIPYQFHHTLTVIEVNHLP